MKKYGLRLRPSAYEGLDEVRDSPLADDGKKNEVKVEVEDTVKSNTSRKWSIQSPSKVVGGRKKSKVGKTDNLSVESPTNSGNDIVNKTSDTVVANVKTSDALVASVNTSNKKRSRSKSIKVKPVTSPGSEVVVNETNNAGVASDAVVANGNMSNKKRSRSKSNKVEPVTSPGSANNEVVVTNQVGDVAVKSEAKGKSRNRQAVAQAKAASTEAVAQLGTQKNVVSDGQGTSVLIVGNKAKGRSRKCPAAVLKISEPQSKAQRTDAVENSQQECKENEGVTGPAAGGQHGSRNVRSARQTQPLSVTNNKAESTESDSLASDSDAVLEAEEVEFKKCQQTKSQKSKSDKQKQKDASRDEWFDPAKYNTKRGEAPQKRKEGIATRC